MAEAAKIRDFLIMSAWQGLIPASVASPLDNMVWMTSICTRNIYPPGPNFYILRGFSKVRLDQNLIPSFCTDTHVSSQSQPGLHETI